MRTVHKPMKVCSSCKANLPSPSFQQDASKRDGLRSACKDCSSRRYRAWRDADPERARALWRKASNRYSRGSKYGLSAEQIEEMYRSQDYRCAICRCTEDQVRGRVHGVFHIDHDHETGEVRGLLCDRCNIGIGRFGDDLQLLEAAVEYLRASSQASETVSTLGS